MPISQDHRSPSEEVLSAYDSLAKMGCEADLLGLLSVVFGNSPELEDVPSAELTMSIYDASELLANREELGKSLLLFSQPHVFVILEDLIKAAKSELKGRTK